MFKEFPKALYHGGAVDATCVVVADAGEESAARAGGYASAGEGAKPAKEVQEVAPSTAEPEKVKRPYNRKVAA